MARETCRASSDDLNCYEFSGGFRCYLPDGHTELHVAEENNQIIMWGSAELWKEMSAARSH